MNTDIPNRRLAVVSLVIIAVLFTLGSLIANVLYELRIARAVDVANVRIAEVLYEGLLRNESVRPEAAKKSAQRLAYADVIGRCERKSIRNTRPAEKLRVLDEMVCHLEKWGMPRLYVYVLEAEGYHAGLKFLLGIDQQSIVRVINIIEHQESSDFGAVLLSGHSEWLSSLLDRPLAYYLTPPQDAEIDMISGATITADAMRNAIAEALKLNLEKR